MISSHELIINGSALKDNCCRNSVKMYTCSSSSDKNVCTLLAAVGRYTNKKSCKNKVFHLRKFWKTVYSLGNLPILSVPEFPLEVHKTEIGGNGNTHIDYKILHSFGYMVVEM